MPDVYGQEDFDLAGFSVGVVDREKLIDGSKIQAGDVLVGLPSSGFHSNGYSLIRKVVFEHAGLSIDSHVESLDQTVSEALLTPTKIYAPEVAAVMASDLTRSVTGIAHITGGGLQENLERIVPEGCTVSVDRSSWTPAACFGWLQSLGSIDEEEMFRVFNMGVGLVFVVRPEAVNQLQETLRSTGSDSFVLGEIGSTT
jgi:phosphoribosylformylglycinamidine cyclo-ligase